MITIKEYLGEELLGDLLKDSDLEHKAIARLFLLEYEYKQLKSLGIELIQAFTKHDLKSDYLVFLTWRFYPNIKITAPGMEKLIHDLKSDLKNLHLDDLIAKCILRYS